MRNLLEALCAPEGVSGQETAAAAVAARLLSAHCNTRQDTLGSVVGERPGTGPHILLDAHLDQVGMVVTGYEDGGFLRVAKCGGMDRRVLAAQPVCVHGQELVPGILPAPAPHLAKEGDKAPGWEALCIDTGLPRERLEVLVPLGSRVTLQVPPTALLGQRFTAPALDNRAGVAAALRCLAQLPEQQTGRITALFSAQEETGGSGARAAAFACQADVALVIDVSFGKAPGVPERQAQGRLGGGVMIGIAPTLDADISEELRALAQQENIPYQLEIMGGRTGTNAEQIQTAGGGIPCGLLSIPLRNMHTGAEVVDLEDIESTARLLAAYISYKGKGAAA